MIESGADTIDQMKSIAKGLSGRRLSYEELTCPIGRASAQRLGNR